MNVGASLFLAGTFMRTIIFHGLVGDVQSKMMGVALRKHMFAALSHAGAAADEDVSSRCFWGIGSNADGAHTVEEGRAGGTTRWPGGRHFNI